MTFKIELYTNGSKRKHRLYDILESNNAWKVQPNR